MTSLKSNLYRVFVLFLLSGLGISCSERPSETTKIEPLVKTELVPHDTDDPAIWIHPQDVSQSLIIGTDKEIGGGVYSFDLSGHIIDSLSLLKINYPNNVDLLTNVTLPNGEVSDIIAFTERESHQIRVFSYPGLEALDQGGFPVFVDAPADSLKRPMGIAFYRAPHSEKIYVVVSRKVGPSGSYLYQYELQPDRTSFQSTWVRSFGQFSGEPSEIEALMVDPHYGFLYYSDEGYGIRKYYADPEKGDEEVAVFGLDRFREDREGIALWPTDNKGNGYIIVSNQQDNSFNVYQRKAPHKYVGNLPLSTLETDGCDLYPDSLSPQFPNGIFVAMTEGKQFHYYDLGALAEYLNRIE